MKTIPLKLDEMEQDLILACKCHYGHNGIEKVIAHYCRYEPEHCDMGAKYHFISELIVKLIDNGNIRISYLIDQLSPRNINGFCSMDEKLSASEKVYKRMVSIINNINVKEQDKDGNYYDLIELHDADPRFKEKEEEVIVNV